MGKPERKMVNGDNYESGKNLAVIGTMKNLGRVLGSVIIIGAFLFALAGCGMNMEGDHDGSTSSINEGFFIDSPVKGLRYESETQSGTTGPNGRFYYTEGEMVTFKLGSMVLGSCPGANFVTPIDMVPGAVDETHPTVTNMLRFFQTMDEDNNPENGINLPPYMMDELERHEIDFNMSTEEFEHNPEFQEFMTDMHNMHENYGNRMMVSVEDAQAHMRNTMMSMMGGGFDPHNMQGSFIDSPVQGLFYETKTHSGTTNQDGHFYYSIGEDVTFSMGGIELGKTFGKAFVTPVDMVPGAMDETHPEVTNMLIFLQTMDEDNFPENGIHLPEYVHGELEGRTIDFTMDPGAFINDPDLMMFMDTMRSTYSAYMGRMMVSSNEAQEHMRESIIDMHNRNYRDIDDRTDDINMEDHQNEDHGMMM